MDNMHFFPEISLDTADRRAGLSVGKFPLNGFSGWVSALKSTVLKEEGYFQRVNHRCFIMSLTRNHVHAFALPYKPKRIGAQGNFDMH